MLTEPVDLVAGAVGEVEPERRRRVTERDGLDLHRASPSRRTTTTRAHPVIALMPRTHEPASSGGSSSWPRPVGASSMCCHPSRRKRAFWIYSLR